MRVKSLWVYSLLEILLFVVYTTDDRDGFKFSINLIKIYMNSLDMIEGLLTVKTLLRPSTSESHRF